MKFTYEAFVDEIKLLIESGGQLVPAERNSRSESFTKWRHELYDLTSRIENLGYDVRSTFRDRFFGEVRGYSSYSESQQRDAFDRDFSAVLMELSLIVSRFDKFGDPHQTETIAVEGLVAPIVDTQIELLPEDRKFPDKVTILWLIQNVPLSGWAALCGMLGVVFTAGSAFGAWSIIQSWLTKHLA